MKSNKKSVRETREVTMKDGVIVDVFRPAKLPPDMKEPDLPPFVDILPPQRKEPASPSSEEPKPSSGGSGDENLAAVVPMSASEAARRLALAGGSEPQLEPIPRRRSADD